MDIKEKLKLLNTNSFYGVGQIDRDCMIKEVEDILRRKKMAEKSNNEWFVKKVEETANVAISAGKDANEVIHDAIEVLYGRKNINELLPTGWIIPNNCSECAYDCVPSDNEPCLKCYNKIFLLSDFHAADAGPYTNNFKPKEEKEDSDALKHWCADCEYYNTDASHYPCCSCFFTDERACFRPLKQKEE